MTQHPVTRIAIDFADEKFLSAINLIKQPLIAQDVFNLLKLIWLPEFDHSYFDEAMGELPAETEQVDASVALKLISDTYIGAKFDSIGLDAQALSVTIDGPTNWPVVELELNHDRDEAIRKLRKLGYDESVIND